MIVTLERIPLPTQVNGVLIADNGISTIRLHTLELPWKNNQPFISCIPTGHYLMSPWVSPKFGKCYIIEGGTVGKTFGQRTHCLFHAANWVGQLNGCIAVGDGWSGNMLLNSKKSCTKLFEFLEWKETKLVITEV